MTTGQCHRRWKMMGRGCGTEEKHCPVSTSRVSNKCSPEDIDTDRDKDISKDVQLARTVGIDLYSQACKALAVVHPFDVEDGQNKSAGIVSTTLPAGLASCLSKQSDNSHKRRKKSHLGSDTKKNKSSFREKVKVNSIWSETEDYFRELSVEDVERLNGSFQIRGNMLISIPYPGNRKNEGNDIVNDSNNKNNHDGGVVAVAFAGGGQQDVNQFMEVDGVGVNDNTQSQQEDNNGISLPQSSGGVEWLLGSRSKIYLTSERPSKKRKLLGGEAGLEKLFVARAVKDEGPSTCCHYCSIGDMGNQLNRLIVCKSCGVAVHERCYGVQQDDGDGCWECSWCMVKRGEDKVSDSCLLCPQQGGALKPVKKRRAGDDDRGVVEFAHLFCCQWMPEVYVEDTKSMEPIMNIEGIKDVQKKLICYLCKVKCGACVRCSYGSCRTSFHPVCAREARHRMEIWGKFGCDDVELRAFCSKHSEPQKEGSPHIEDALLGPKLNNKSQTECIDGTEVKGSSTVEDVKVSDSNNVTLLLKKLIDRGSVILNDLASDISVSAGLLASNLADDCLPAELHGKIVKWLKSHAHIGGVQKNLKLKVISKCLSKVEKDSSGENADIRASANSNVGSSPVKLAPSHKKTKGNIRVLKDNGLVLSFKRSSADDGVVMDDDHNGGNISNQGSSPDSKEKIISESCPASDQLAGNAGDDKGDIVKCSSPSQNGCCQMEGAMNSNCDIRVKSNLANHDCSIAMTDNPVALTEASPGSYIHPLILTQNNVLPKMKADGDDGTGIGYHPNQNSDSTELTCELRKANRMSIINLSPIDEVEGELVYYQHQLLCNAAARKHLSDALISKVTKCLPQDIEAVRRHSWDAVMVSQYLSDLREFKKQGRKERRHKEAQAVLAAATAAAAASSRLSSLRKDTIDESLHQENTLKIKAFGGRGASNAQQVFQAKEAHSKLSVTWNSPEMNHNSSSTLDNKVHSRVCDVCRRAETILNPIIVCSSCKVAVHIDCYRSVKDSTGPWFCELCEDLFFSRSRGVPSRVGECGLCGGTTGAFRKSTDGQWVHAFCAEWVLESTFRRGQVKAIEGMEAISKGNDVCLVCSRKDGVCIKCNYGHCQSTFHPTCGRNAGLFLNVRTIGGKIQHKAYCDKHSLAERNKAETQKHGAEEWNSLKKVRVELERLRLICERIIKREKLKRELVLCSHDMLRCNRESISSSMRSCTTTFVSPDVSSESATTSLRGGYTNSYNSRSETIQRSDDVTIDSTVAGKRRVKFPLPTVMDNDQKTDDSSTSQIFTQTPSVRSQLSGKQIPQRPSAVSRTASDDVGKFFRHGKHSETFEKELVMTSDQASMRNQRLPKGFVYVPIRCLSNEEETIAAAGAAAATEENSGQDE